MTTNPHACGGVFVLDRIQDNYKEPPEAPGGLLKMSIRVKTSVLEEPLGDLKKILSGLRQPMLK